MKHLIETTDPSGLPTARYDRIILNSSTDDVIVRGGVTYEVVPDSYIYNETDNKYYQKLVGYGEPTEIDDIDLNSEWISDTTDDKYKYFKSDSYNDLVEEVNGERFSYSYSQCKVTWSNLSSITFKYMSSGDMGELIVLKMDSEKFTPSTSEDDIYLSLFDETPGTYDEFTIECDKGEHHIWFCYLKEENATDEDCGFIGVPKYVAPILDIKQGAELPMEYKSGGVSAEGGKTYDINFNSVTLPNGSIIVPSYEDYTKTEKAITYEYVDLGLKSGLKWAKCNIGATSETDYGVYFQWGDISGVSGSLLGKNSADKYSWRSYIHCNGSETTLTKYNTSTSYGENPDNMETLETVDDAATQIMGNEWRMPTKDELQELLNGTTNKWVTDYNGTGVNGRMFTGPNGNSIFFPAAGFCHYGLVFGVGDDGYVWSSSLVTSLPGFAWGLYFNSGDCNVSHGYGRYYGYVVRGVRK